MLSDNVTDDNPEHLENAFFPIVVTVFGKVIVVNTLHDWNADCPIVLTLSPIVTVVNLAEYSNE